MDFQRETVSERKAAVRGWVDGYWAMGCQPGTQRARASVDSSSSPNTCREGFRTTTASREAERQVLTFGRVGVGGREASRQNKMAHANKCMETNESCKNLDVTEVKGLETGGHK